MYNVMMPAYVLPGHLVYTLIPKFAAAVFEKYDQNICSCPGTPSVPGHCVHRSNATRNPLRSVYSLMELMGARFYLRSDVKIRGRQRSTLKFTAYKYHCQPPTLNTL